MIPQIDNSLIATDLLTQKKLPNKTYKLIFDEDNFISNYLQKLITFEIGDDGNLYVNYPELENLDEFEIDGSNLYVTSTDADIEEKYSIIEWYLMLNNASKFLAAETVDRISGFITNRDAIKQAIYHILSVERYSNLIYDDNYGIELNQYIGQGIEYLRSSIEDTLYEALKQDERIINVTVTDVEEITRDSALVKFNVKTVLNEVQMEVNVNV